MSARALLLGIVALAGCAGAPVELASDAVIAGTRYAGTPVELGPVRMRVSLREDAPPAGAAQENLRVVLGFLASGEPAQVVLSRATLRYGDKVATLVARQAAGGTAQDCAPGGGAALPLDYWFNATVTAQAWRCVTLAFVAPGRMNADRLELRAESLSVDGEAVHLLPVTFARRVD